MLKSFYLKPQNPLFVRGASHGEGHATRTPPIFKTNNKLLSRRGTW